jgi:Ni,Fe-hydrogenase III small subunit/Pyruvate/2-oxoacid:ferredoxin oxidoreductase delta subunit
MFDIVRERLRQGHRTFRYPELTPELPERFLGRPRISAAPCPTGCADCLGLCPVKALELTPQGPALDMGRCVFCGDCARACPKKTIAFTRDHRIASRSREGLIITSADPGPPPGDAFPLFRRSLRLRQVSAAGCNACEADCNVLTTPVFDLGRYGLDFVAAPRHADAIAVTGPVSENMRQATLDTFDAVPDPRLVIAVGSCAISGGVFQDSEECHRGVSMLPVDLYIPGCPPHPWTILDGLLMLMGRSGRQASAMGR